MKREEQKTVFIGVKVTPAMKGVLETEAARLGVNQSEVVRLAIIVLHDLNGVPPTSAGE